MGYRFIRIYLIRSEYRKTFLPPKAYEVNDGVYKFAIKIVPV